ncbi:MAG: DUF2782 domain-containing protein [Gammaproteobacteria bacterium]
MRKSILLLALLSGSALAVDPPAPPAMQPVPDAAPEAAPDAPQPGETVEPQVTIVQHENETIEEYRIHNQLYMIKVTPKHGKPYYLVDTRGDGKLDTRRDKLDSNMLIPSWVLLKW